MGGKQLKDDGAAAIIMYSLFEEAITAETESVNRFLNQQDTAFAEAVDGFLPDWNDFSTGSDQYLDNLRRLKEALGIPVIASLNGVTPSGWVEHGRGLEQAGADVVHLCTLLKHGAGQTAVILKGIEQWMEEQSFESVEDFRGRVSAMAVPNPAELERANHVNIIDSYSFAPGVMV